MRKRFAGQSSDGAAFRSRDFSGPTNTEPQDSRLVIINCLGYGNLNAHNLPEATTTPSHQHTMSLVRTLRGDLPQQARSLVRWFIAIHANCASSFVASRRRNDVVGEAVKRAILGLLQLWTQSLASRYSSANSVDLFSIDSCCGKATNSALTISASMRSEGPEMLSEKTMRWKTSARFRS